MNFCIKLVAACASSILIGAFGLSAQDAYPSKAIELTGPYSAGGGTDRLARFTATALAEEIGAPINVVNHPGGGLLSGTLYFYNQEPDGYNIMFTPPTPYMVKHIEVMGAP